MSVSGGVSELTACGQKALIAGLMSVMTGAMLLCSPAAHASDLLREPSLLAAQESTTQVPPGILLAQNDTDDAYDPFADYSEFEESMDEEEDINFFRNGRLFTLGFIGGYRGWTQTLGHIYSGNASFGLFLTYFFDLRFAMQLGYLASDHTLVIKPAYTGQFNPVQGTINISDINLLLKYYFNTQNVTRGLAELNPYIVGGFSQIYRTLTASGSTNTAKDSAFAFDAGAGVELPLMRNKMFFGLQGLFQYISFADEATVMQDDMGTKTGVAGTGDGFLVLGVLGINF